jgi:NAD(P)-dependent dehydrogenase (short-subunit alcohol dehydrogenase family)
MLSRDDLKARFDLDGRVAIVTGGSRGIGLAMAQALGSCGARVTIASRKAEACDEVAATIRAAGGEAIGIPANTGDLDDVNRIVDATVEAFGGIDMVVNNAANALAQRIGSITPEAWDKTQAVNERGPLFLVQAALPHLERSEHASVLNIVSVGVFTSGGGLALYAAAKAGLLMLTRSMAAELASKGIRVNALAPGAVDTDMMRANPDAAVEAMRSGSVMNRLADPDEMVGPGLFLLSDLSSFVTGSVLVADGGMTFH